MQKIGKMELPFHRVLECTGVVTGGEWSASRSDGNYSSVPPGCLVGWRQSRAEYVDDKEFLPVTENIAV
jgi:hypothetical protein